MLCASAPLSAHSSRLREWHPLNPGGGSRAQRTRDDNRIIMSRLRRGPSSKTGQCARSYPVATRTQTRGDQHGRIRIPQIPYILLYTHQQCLWATSTLCKPVTFKVRKALWYVLHVARRLCQSATTGCNVCACDVLCSRRRWCPRARGWCNNTLIKAGRRVRSSILIRERAPGVSVVPREHDQHFPLHGTKQNKIKDKRNFLDEFSSRKLG